MLKMHCSEFPVNLMRQETLDEFINQKSNGGNWQFAACKRRIKPNRFFYYGSMNSHQHLSWYATILRFPLQQHEVVMATEGLWSQTRVRRCQIVRSKPNATEDPPCRGLMQVTSVVA
ncbi:hypothetical protein TNCV_721991 [Trichonephila clavipes]|nr:hypothetical protein TNCV_721991 [Trichonephila clavipes]